MSSESRLNPDTSMWDWITDDLRHHVKKSGLSGAELARILNRDPSSVYNILNGRRRIQDKDAKILDKLWDLNHHFGRMLRYAKLKSNSKWFGQYLEHEVAAKVIKSYEALAIPGLLQLPEYAAELFTATGAADVDGLVEERMRRQEILKRDSPPMLWLLLTENVLDWPVGGAELMRKQLSRLLEEMEKPNIGLRIVPRAAGAHGGFSGSFLVISGDSGDIAYTEATGGGRLVPSVTEVREYGIRFDRIGQLALPEPSSRELVQRALEAL
ncbi:helix-turn-helix domain-containing protein [Actinoallomurus sp. CA-142502]|uniref:helix-turn-helix domain-containing protein n=1 Tax=Actinoallomurus sp. CA-142502 TaxID=3239885 RepID=UPI003D8B5939